MKSIRIWFMKRWFYFTRWVSDKLQPYCVVNWPTYNKRLAAIRWWCVRQTEYYHKRIHDLECKCGVKLVERS